MSIAYFAHELADAAVQRRADMLALGGQEVTLLGFERLRHGRSHTAPKGAHVLGQTRNRALVHRIFAVAAALPKAIALRRVWRNADVIMARNLEMLVLATAAATLTGCRARMVYECLDLHRLILQRGPVGALLRAVERACLSRVALVLTSSPAFERKHFLDAQRYQGPVLLVENKVLSAGAAASPASRPADPPWIIAWCGVLRCRRSFLALRALAEKAAGRVRVDLWGTPDLAVIPEFHTATATSGALQFHGPYAASDLPAIYERAHFAWAADFYEAGGNSEMLLPNRLYESLAFGAAPIAVAGAETERWLSRHNVGVVLQEPVEEALNDFFGALTLQAYDAISAAVARLDPDATRFTPERCRAIVAEIAGAA